MTGHACCKWYRLPAPLYQEVGNDVAPKWAIDKLSEFKHLVS